ncbi:rnp1p [Saccharomyces arboricola H-6]|uniref:Rnp1p n=1 Tax=Saccharomyces arboricola (strain H-6 / AS 2.3317 / CBS 10644) TaxID=1160507 RepID=J8PZM2_SACAR|nr:rnp1p [Saccharomyces arboricola H-6]
MLIEEIEFYNANGSKTTTVVPEKKKFHKRALDERRSLYVGNLPKNCHKQDLRDLFQPTFGKITINMLTKKQLKKQLKIFAFIEFEGGVDLKKVKEKMNDKLFMDKRIVIEYILTKEEKNYVNNNDSKKNDSNTKNIPELKPLSTHTLYVKNIPVKSSNEELAKIFGVAPKNVNFVKRQLVDLRTNKTFFSDEFHTGEAFIKFDNLCAEDNIQKKCQLFKGQKASNGRVLLVKVASAKKNEQGPDPEGSTKIIEN